MPEPSKRQHGQGGAGSGHHSFQLHHHALRFPFQSRLPMLGLEMHHFGSLIPFLVQKDADAADEGAGQLRQMCREDRSGGGRLQGFARLGFNGLDDRHLKAQKRAEEVAANQQSIGRLQERERS